MLERSTGKTDLEAFQRSLARGENVLDSCLDDADAERRIVVRFADMCLGPADASVVASARRLGARVMNLDRRRFKSLSGALSCTIPLVTIFSKEFHT